MPGPRCSPASPLSPFFPLLRVFKFPAPSRGVCFRPRRTDTARLNEATHFLRGETWKLRVNRRWPVTIGSGEPERTGESRGPGTKRRWRNRAANEDAVCRAASGQRKAFMANCVSVERRMRPGRKTKDRVTSPDISCPGKMKFSGSLSSLRRL